jgi:hypothetical protein
MLKTNVAHVIGADRDDGGRALAMTVFHRGEQGVLVWAGRPHRLAESKVAAEILPSDYFSRETVSFMSWQDIEAYFARPLHAPLVDTLLTQFKWHERPVGSSEKQL